MGKRERDEEASFETSLERLETIANQLEDGELALEKSLELFEEGVSLAARLEKRLAEAELRVEKLVETSGGTETAPLELADVDADDEDGTGE